jgi:hypothetical protein
METNKQSRSSLGIKLGTRLVARTARLLALVVLGTALVGAAGCGGGGGGAADPTDPSTAGSGSTSAAKSTGSSTTTSAGGPAARVGSPSASPSGAAASPAGTTTAAGAASPAAGTSTAPAAAPAPAAASGSAATGTIIPLYSAPASGTWDAVIAAKQAHPSVPALAVINPANGPGTAALSDYMAGIAKLTAAGVKVIGYVHTSYGARAAADVEADVARWKSLYTGVTGIFFDEMANVAGQESYYQGLSSNARGQGFDFTIGNPGADGAASYVGTVDVILVYENRGVPAAAALAGWHTGYDRHNFGVIPYGVPSLDASFVKSASTDVGYVYVQNDDLPNPWDTVPPYLDALFAALG